jgi:thymidylate synthase (FAD)
MNVRLSSVTSDAEQFVIYVARVSNPENQNNPNIARLIRYLINNKHWSPFEHASMTVEIETSRAIAAQILRHRSFSFQEFSQRYSQAAEWEPVELRRQAESNRQSSTEIFNPVLDPGADIKYYALDMLRDSLYDAFNVYNKLLDMGVAKESARFVLPLATKTRLYMTGSIRSWIHYIALRTDEHTQKEHRDIANSIKALFVKQFPIISEALVWS